MVANINPQTNIAYGYIGANSLDSGLVDELIYGDQSTNETANEAFEDYQREHTLEDGESFGPDYNPDRFWDHYEDYEPDISGEYEGVKYRTSWLGGALNFFILESPHVTDKARLASPCVPNAGIIDTLDGSVQSYDVPLDWRRND